MADIYPVEFYYEQWMMARARAREYDASRNGLFPKTERQQAQYDEMVRLADMMASRIATKTKDTFYKKNWGYPSGAAR